MTLLMAKPRPAVPLGLWVRRTTLAAVPILTEVSPFALRTPAQRVAYWKSMDSRKAAWQRSVKRLVAKQFTTEGRAVAAGFTLHGHPGAMAAVQAARPSWLKLFSHLYQQVGGDFAMAMFRHGVSKSLVIKADGDWTSAITDYLRRNAATKVQGIEDYTQEEIGRELAEGFAEGEGTVALAKRLTDLYDEFSTYRAERIARTEVAAAANLGSREGAKATELELEKEWISIQDDRTRGQKPKDEFDHVDMDGVTAPMDDPYDVDGEELMFPCDASLGASAGNLINCRCSEGYHRASD